MEKGMGEVKTRTRHLQNCFQNPSQTKKKKKRRMGPLLVGLPTNDV
jgi:hypothetical protein